MNATVRAAETAVQFLLMTLTGLMTGGLAASVDTHTDI